MLQQLGFTFRGRHRSKPVRLWTQGQARVVCNEQQARDWAPTLAAIGFEVADPAASAQRARDLDAPSVFRRSLPVSRSWPPSAPRTAPRSSSSDVVDGDPAWAREFEAGDEPGEEPLLTGDRPRQPGPALAALRRGRALLQQRPRPASRAAARRSRPRPGWCAATSYEATTARSGSRSTSRRSPTTIRRASRSTSRSAAPTCSPSPARARERGLRTAADPRQLLRRPGRPVRPRRRTGRRAAGARRALRPRRRGRVHALLHRDRSAAVFFEVVQRRGGYEGYGAANAPVRLAAQHVPSVSRPGVGARSGSSRGPA